MSAVTLPDSQPLCRSLEGDPAWVQLFVLCLALSFTSGANCICPDSGASPSVAHDSFLSLRLLNDKREQAREDLKGLEETVVSQFPAQLTL